MLPGEDDENVLETPHVEGSRRKVFHIHYLPAQSVATDWEKPGKQQSLLFAFFKTTAAQLEVQCLRTLGQLRLLEKWQT